MKAMPEQRPVCGWVTRTTRRSGPMAEKWAVRSGFVVWGGRLRTKRVVGWEGGGGILLDEGVV